MGKDDLKQLIAQARLDEAVAQLLEQIKAYSPASKSDKSVGKLSDILIINSGKLHGLQHDKMLGILDRQNEQVTMAQVQQAILYVLDELPDEFWNVPAQHPSTKQNSGNEQTELLEAVESLKQVQSGEFEYDLFVSFSSFDGEVLLPVVEKLRGYGLRVFISDQNLKDYAGISFSDTIEHALEYSQHFVLVSSPNSAKSGWVKYEYKTFFDQFHVHDQINRHIFVLRGIGFDLKFVPLFLRNMQIADNAEQIVNTLVAESRAQQQLKIKNEELRIKERKAKEAAEKVEEERIEADKQAKILAEEQLKEKQQKAEHERLEQQKFEEEQAEQQRLAAQKATEERIKTEKQDKLIADQLLKEKQQKAEQERLELQKLQKELERTEKQRLATQKAEEERIENEKQAKLLVDKQLKEKQQKEEQDRLKQQKLEEERVEQERLAAQKAEEEQSMPVLNQQPTSAETHRSLQDPAASKKMNPNRKKLIYLLSPFVLIICIYIFYIAVSDVIRVDKLAIRQSSGNIISKIDSFPIEMVFVKGGEFIMGDDNGVYTSEKPAHKVFVSDFYIGKYEVTQKQWTDIMGSNPSYFKGCDKCPVDSVSWNDVQEFIKKLNQKTGKTYRLPTEAEWEYAAGGGANNRTKWAGTNNESELKNYAWYGSNSGSKTHPVGTTAKANSFGIYDMTGNVWEWCNDWFGSDYYQSSPFNNPQGPSSGYSRVLRGGSWHYETGGGSVASRRNSRPDIEWDYCGFRLLIAFQLTSEQGKAK